LISLRSIRDLGGIEMDDPCRIGSDDPCRIGSGVTVAEIAGHAGLVETFPALTHAARSLGSRQIRNVATIGGNVCKASPAADLACPLLVYGSWVEMRGPSSTREVAVDEFFRGPGETLLEEDEIVTAVILDRPPEEAWSLFLRRGRTAVDCATVNLAAYAEVDGDRVEGVRLAVGAVAPTPLRLREVEALVEGKELGEELLAEAAKAAMEAVSPITDIRSTAEYRRHLVGVFVRRALRGLTDR
jgi:carbon-monoxide dehydrogenase medium subunit